FMDLHFEDIHIFTAVAETPNLLEATILLNMSVASVIKRLTEFEENLDIILFERRKKKFILTPLGETVYEYVISTRGNLERFIKEFKCEKLKLELFCESADYVSLFDSWVYDFCLKNTGV
ncbi:LysR family transcriptional regulator, partial [Pantoea dispersa]